MKRLLALIFATISSLLFWNSCSQKEQDIPVAFVTLSQPAAEMIIGEFITLKATISPSNATEREIMWASSKQSVASVDQTGKVVAIAEGTSTITATAGGKLGSCVVTVSKGVVEVSSINFDKTGVSLKVGETVTLTATVKPDNATDKTVTWSSSDASIATVGNGVVTALKLGTATITAKAGDKEATCAITVEATPVTSVTLDKTNASLKVGETETLTATVKPDDATDKTVTWSSSDASIATVENGVVTAKNVGSATITAKAGDNEATCFIIVDAPIKPLTFTASGEVSIALIKEGAPNTISLEYSKDGIIWLDYQIGEYLYLSDGEQLSFRAGPKGNNSFSTGYWSYYRFENSELGTFAASGNIMSLMNRDCNTPLTSYAFRGLFANCVDLTQAPELPAMRLTNNCYQGMFMGCQLLTTAPELPATTLASECYAEMFEGCTGLTTVADLPATTLPYQCYYSMFKGCTGLKHAPKISGMALNESCCTAMFRGCSSMITAPELPAITLAKCCYERMFQGCASLTVAPELPATTLAQYCYLSMFEDCIKLVAPPELPSTKMEVGCYYSMFKNCKTLTAAPILTASKLYEKCYREMFSGCLNLSYVKALFKTAPGDNYTQNWLYSVSKTGTFIKASDATWDVTGSSGIPSGWTIQIE